MHKKVLIMVILAAFLLFGVIFISTGASYVPFYQKEVVSNVYAGDAELSGLTRKEGIEKLNNYTGELEKENITLYSGEKKGVHLLPFKKAGIKIDAEKVMNQALKIGHTGPIWERWQERHRVKENGVNLPLAIEIEEERLKKEVDSLFSDTIHPPENAGYEITPGDKVEIIPGKKGVRVEHNVLKERLKKRIVSNDKPFRVKVPMVEADPSRTTEEIKKMGLKGLISSYSTKFDPSEKSRVYNLKVAAETLDGLIVPPEKEVSFNETVGPRNTENGYKKAKIILNSELVDGIGGGVCQVSSTLYNAVLLANLTITERYNHSIPVNYVPLGRDATVVYNHIDLCFINDTENHILIKSELTNDTLTFKIYGNDEVDRDVQINTEVDEVIEPETNYEEDPSLTPGEEEVKREGITGYEVSGEIIIKENGKKITRSLPESNYEPRDKIIAVGTGDDEFSYREKDIELEEDESKELQEDED